MDELIFFPSRSQFSSASLFYMKLVWQFLVYALLEMEARWAFSLLGKTLAAFLPIFGKVKEDIMESARHYDVEPENYPGPSWGFFASSFQPLEICLYQSPQIGKSFLGFTYFGWLNFSPELIQLQNDPPSWIWMGSQLCQPMNRKKKLGKKPLLWQEHWALRNLFRD